jgi:hypothetical protein
MDSNNSTGAADAMWGGKEGGEFKKKYDAMFTRAPTGTRSQAMFCLGCCCLTAYFTIWPWFKHHLYESMGFHYSHKLTDQQTTMPYVSTGWWANQWRFGIMPWKQEETAYEKHFDPIFKFVEEVAGRKMIGPEPISREVEENPTLHYNERPDDRELEVLRRKARKFPQAFVPMCGDTPVMRYLIENGYSVHGVEVSSTAMNHMLAYIEGHIPKEKFGCANLYLENLFAVDIWNLLPQMDFIYDRQGMSAVAPKERADYAFLLQRVLKPDGVLYIEAIHRPMIAQTKNHKNGPPYNLDEGDIRRLFPEGDGFFVKCKTSVLEQKMEKEAKRKKMITLDFVPAVEMAYPCVVLRNR